MSTPTAMKPLLLVDYDGTLCFDRFWQTLEPALFARIQELLFTPQNPRLEQWMRGQLTSEQINSWLADNIPTSFEQLWAVFVHDCKKMRVSEAALTHLATLRARFTTILLTDNMDCFTRFTVPELRLHAHFDHILNSADHGMMKRDNEGELFQRLAKEHRTEMSRVWLIDNSSSTCEQVNRLGGKGCLVTTQQPVEVWLAKL